MKQDSVQYEEFSEDEKCSSQNAGQNYDQASTFHEYTMEISNLDFTSYEYESGCESFPECHKQQKSPQNYYRSQDEFRTLNCDSPQNPQIDSSDYSYNNFSDNLGPSGSQSPSMYQQKSEQLFQKYEYPHSPCLPYVYDSDYYEEIFK